MAKPKHPPPPKKKGSKDRVPGGRTVKASVKAIIQDVVEKEQRTVRGAIVRGLKAAPRDAHHYVKLAVEYTDGKPDQNLRMQFDVDELAEAKTSLHKKLDELLVRVNAALTLKPPSE